MRRSEREIIRRLPLFKGMTDAHFDLLIRDGFLQRFPARTDLIAEGDIPDFLHIVVEGIVELFASHQGRKTVLDIVRPMTTFILAAVIRDEVYLKSARTLVPSRILMIPAHVVRGVFERDAAFARAVVNELALRYRVIVRTLKNDRLRNGTERLLNWILQADRAQGGRGRIRLPFDKRTLASQLGMTAESLSRSLTSLKKHGIAARGRDILVADRKALRALAKPSLLIDG
jgi:CRP/FNR family transcriptional regulator, transcriptional activator FtrB